MDKEHEGNPDEWDIVLDTNIKALLAMTRLVVPGMVERGRGHVINMGSIAGDYAYPGGSVYCASKAAVKALSDGLRIDLVDTPRTGNQHQARLGGDEFLRSAFPWRQGGCR